MLSGYPPDGYGKFYGQLKEYYLGAADPWKATRGSVAGWTGYDEEFYWPKAITRRAYRGGELSPEEKRKRKRIRRTGRRAREAARQRRRWREDR